MAIRAVCQGYMQYSPYTKQLPTVYSQHQSTINMCALNVHFQNSQKAGGWETGK